MKGRVLCEAVRPERVSTTITTTHETSKRHKHVTYVEALGLSKYAIAYVRVRRP